MGETLFERYRRLEGELEGKWFALSEDGEVLADAGVFSHVGFCCGKCGFLYFFASLYEVV